MSSHNLMFHDLMMFQTVFQDMMMQSQEDLMVWFQDDVSRDHDLMSGSDFGASDDHNLIHKNDY